MRGCVSWARRGRTASTRVCGSDRAELSESLDIEDLHLGGSELGLHSDSSRRNVLEGGGSSLGGRKGGGELGNEGVGSESVEEVDVSRGSGEDWKKSGLA